MHSETSPIRDEPGRPTPSAGSTDAAEAAPTAQAGPDASGQPAATDKAECPAVSDATQDVRFAVAMSGGVSLAVWMGGVAREVNLLQQASNFRLNETGSRPPGRPPGTVGTAAPGDGPDSAHAPDWDAKSRDLYLKLLRLLDVKVTVDVMSGTSAGGVNAALLGLSSAAGVDLGGLRDLWLTTGSMDLLLRDPGEPDPPSLMQGDKVLFSQLASGIRQLYEDGRRDTRLAPPPDSVDTTVFITTTMMSGETSRFTDDYGTLVPDVDHHGLFTFGQETLASDAGESLTALALAARSSASFPGAFEPSFVPINCRIGSSQGIPDRPDMAGFANMTRSHWVADGGLLANRPLTPLLASVFSQPARGQVRRVLAFVVPDGGGTSSPAAQPAPAKFAQLPTMFGALKADLDAQMAQSIASDLQAIRTHNERVAVSHNLRRSLAEMGSRLPGGAGLVTRHLLRDYQRQQGAGLAQPVLAEVMRQLTTMPLPSQWANELSADAAPAEPRMAKEMAHILGEGWNAGALPDRAQAPSGGPAHPGPVPATSEGISSDGAAGEGAAGEGASSEKAADPGSGQQYESQEAVAWAAWNAAGDPFDRAAAFGLPVFHAARATAIHLIRLGYLRAADADQRTKITDHRKEIEDAFEAPRLAWREHDKVPEKLRTATGNGSGSPILDLVKVAADLADAKRRALLIGPGSPPTMRNAWVKLVDAMIPLLADLAPLTTPGGRDSRIEAADAISAYLGYFGPASTPARLADRLLNLVIAERALEPAQPEVDQPVEFIQVSANTRTLLAPKDGTVPAPQRLDIVSKLRGVELHHFAAFYKSSWRAYDWMWGRLDGSGWLVHILLDPRRILAAIEDHYKWHHGKRAENFAKLLRETLGLKDNLPGDCLEHDLAFLDQQGATIPVSLPNSALFLAQAWQNLITASELPTVAGQMPATDAWATKVRNMKDGNEEPEEFARQLPRCPVRRETLAGELRTPAFARTAAKAAAVAAAALTTAPETPAAVRPVLSTAKTVTRTGYLATKATGGSAWKTLAAGAVLAVIGGVLATQGLLVVGVTGTVVALVGLYLIALGAWGIHRGLLGALIAITALALVGSLSLAWVRNELWGTKASSSGLVPRHVLPWLHSTWWGGLALLGGIILLAELLNLLWRRPRRSRGRPRPNSSA